MTREKAIEIIGNLFPVDAPYETTAAIGKELLEQAKANVSSWKTEPDEVLFEYARLCEVEDYRQAHDKAFEKLLRKTT